MLKVYENYSLKELNTFGVNVKAKYYVALNNVECIKNFLSSYEFKNKKRLILGGGSNILFTHDFNGIVLKPDITGIKILKEGKKQVVIKVGAGENWDNFVSFCVKNNYGGIENLSHIPGSVGSSPIQNIGAYGVEVKDVIQEVEALHLDTLTLDVFNVNECDFGYRDSIFKKELKDQYLITSVTFKLLKQLKYITHYGNLNEEIDKLGETNLSNIRTAVINIRNQKLPDPDKIGNAGSFFKNPVIAESLYQNLKKKYPEIPFYKENNNKYKVPAAWLIEQCNYKGVKKGNTGTFNNQPLVLVNYGKATGKEILSFATEIQDTVKREFNINLELEVNVV